MKIKKMQRPFGSHLLLLTAAAAANLLLVFQQLHCTSAKEYRAIHYRIVGQHRHEEDGIAPTSDLSSSSSAAIQYSIANPHPLLPSETDLSSSPVIRHSLESSFPHSPVLLEEKAMSSSSTTHHRHHHLHLRRRLLQSSSSSSSPSQSPACVECFPGSYADGSTNGDSCLPCPKDTFSTMFGSASCTPCPNGTFTEGEGSYYEALCIALVATAKGLTVTMP